MERKFIQTCQEVLGQDVVGDDLTKVKLEGVEKLSGETFFKKCPD